MLSILCLLLNDFFLKEIFHNQITGKLSDFSGLFAFPYFISLLFPKNVKLNYIFSGVLFIIWKSDFIEPLLVFIQNIGIGVNRTVDYYDLFALIILPISYLYWNSKSITIVPLSYIFKPILILVCCFSFIATSLPENYEVLNLKSNLEVKLKANKDEIISQMELTSTHSNKFHSIVSIKKYNSEISYLVTLKENGNKMFTIQLDSVLNFKTNGNLFFGVDKDNIDFMKNLTLKDYEKLFIESKIIALYSDK